MRPVLLLLLANLFGPFAFAQSPTSDPQEQERFEDFNDYRRMSGAPQLTFEVYRQLMADNQRVTEEYEEGQRKRVGFPALQPDMPSEVRRALVIIPHTDGGFGIALVKGPDGVATVTVSYTGRTQTVQGIVSEGAWAELATMEPGAFKPHPPPSPRVRGEPVIQTAPTTCRGWSVGLEKAGPSGIARRRGAGCDMADNSVILYGFALMRVAYDAIPECRTGGDPLPKGQSVSLFACFSRVAPAPRAVP